ncbi:ankyrin repeat-containing domain protein [Aspergillus oleicola]
MRQHYGRMCHSGHDITIDEFIQACADGEYYRVKKLLDEGLTPQIGRQRPLMTAIYFEQAEIAKLLLRRGANDECRAVTEGEWEWPPRKSDNTRSLQYAAIQGKVGVVASLLELGRINWADDVGRTALHFAAKFGHYEVVAMLVDAGADATVMDEEGHTALGYANGAGNTQIAVFLEVVIEKRPLLSCGDAVKKWSVGRDVDDAGQTILRTALSHVAASSMPRLAQYLPEKGVDVDEVDSKGRTALSYACENWPADGARVLVQAGCDVFKFDKPDKTPVNYADGWDGAVKVLSDESMKGDRKGTAGR